MSARDDILGRVRKGLRNGAVLSAEQVAPLEARLKNHPAGLIPKRGRAADRASMARRFAEESAAVHTDIQRVKSLDDIPGAVADYLSRHNLPAELTAAPDMLLDKVPWQSRPLLKLKRGKPDATDQVGLSVAFTAIAETGTLMMLSGPENPSTLNFLPDTHLVVLLASRITAAMEDAWQKLRARGDGAMPRTVNFITGPSSTGDIEQKLEMGAHGPRRQLVMIVEDESLV
jgi:L-lactate dehydrogenase complex protein LldG